VLGPFQGKPACVRIAVGRGVCGVAVEQRRSILVDDVHAFAKLIACDAASGSELVVPLIRANRILGVIDLDSRCSRVSTGMINAASKRSLRSMRGPALTGGTLEAWDL